MKYQRVLIKISGEALMGELDFGLDPQILKQTAQDIVTQVDSGIEVGLVIGGGNIFRGAGLAKSGIDKVSADQMGMLATVMNALAMQDALIKLGKKCRVMSGLRIESVGESFSAIAAREALANGEIVIFAAGTGNPYFTTDTAASLRAIEIKADLLIKATKVDGIYTADPVKDPSATRYDKLSFDEAITQQLAVMDLTAMVLCRENNMSLSVFNVFEQGALTAVLKDGSKGTLVTV